MDLSYLVLFFKVELSFTCALDFPVLRLHAPLDKLWYSGDTAQGTHDQMLNHKL